MKNFEVIGVTISTDVDSLKFDKEKVDEVISSLLDIDGVNNVHHYSNFIIEAEFNPGFKNELGLSNRVRDLKSQIYLTLKSCGVTK